ncbi:MAG: 16S rRNA (cytidine(1402)-2'-O)-methyltransferase [Chloroflexota bacterium]|nr:16S rRNA (cytidine(1402)-2'-O)-methyltransferase [Chloroflexota bacterium]
MQNQTKPGKLYVVATPIGNPKDITQRALDVLKKVDAVICEEFRQGSRLLHQIGVENDLIQLNEHNEADEAKTIVMRLEKGETLAIISDAGTPVFADPGQHLLKLLYRKNIPISPIPGPGSMMAALSLCDFPIDRFIFAGFPPQKTLLRENFLAEYTSKSIPVILMDTPYRLTKLLTEVEHVFGKKQDVLLACDLTLKTENIYRGSVKEILRKVSGKKSEFILIINLNKKDYGH